MKPTAPLPTTILLISILILSSYAMAQPPKNSPLQPTPHLNILYVDDDNIYGPWDGTLEHPYQHIQDAINAATPLDIIKILSGTYHEHIIINRSLKIIGEKTNTTILNGQESHIIVQFQADNIYLQNLTIKNSDGNQTSTGIQITATNTTINSCHIYRTKTAITIQNSTKFTIINCRTYVNGEGILINNSTDGSLQSNYITQNGLGIRIINSTNIKLTDLYIHTNGIGIFVQNTQYLYIDTCAISRNCDNQGALFIYNSTKIRIYDSNFIHNGVGLKIESSKDIDIHKSTLQKNTHFTIMARKNCSNITINLCDISSNYRYGLHLKDSTIIVKNNNFFNNRLYGIHAANTNCQAQHNWWNRTTGPSITGLTKADRISFDPLNIIVFPWKTQKIPSIGATWNTEDIFQNYPLPIDTDRIIILPGNDSDNDMVPDWWEEKWGYNANSWDNHSHLDPDNDALNNIEECYTDEYGSNPFQKDIFLEFDWTLSQNPQNSNLPSQEKITEMTQRFAEHNITIHVDTGQFGGGEEIPYQPQFNYDTLRDLYWQYFLNNDINNPRKGIFHYGIICDVGPGPGFSFIGWYHHDAFCISAQTLEDGNPLWTRDQLIITGSMHELGHTLGLFADDHNGNDNRAAVEPWYKDYWLFRNYKSCMNYRYTWQILDYSDGTHGPGDFDDWGNLDLEFFKNSTYGQPI